MNDARGATPSDLMHLSRALSTGMLLLLAAVPHNVSQLGNIKNPKKSWSWHGMVNGLWHGSASSRVICLVLNWLLYYLSRIKKSQALQKLVSSRYY